VEYTIEGFVEKNRDALEANIAEVLQASALPFVAALIPPEAAVRTLGSQFKAQLLTLMETLNRTSPHFIRCIKSNNLKVSDTFDPQMVLRQLRCLGLKEVVKIRQSGFPRQRQGRRTTTRRREKEKGTGSWTEKRY
jgi:myosin-5